MNPMNQFRVGKFPPRYTTINFSEKKSEKKLKSLPTYKKVEEDPKPKCKCNMEAFKKVSKTRKNNRKEYYCCGHTTKYRDSKKNKSAQQCDFIKWVEPKAET